MALLKNGANKDMQDLKVHTALHLYLQLSATYSHTALNI